MKMTYKHIGYFSMVIVLAVMTLFSACSPGQRGVEPENDREIVDGREFVASLGVHAINLPVNDLRSGGVENIGNIGHMRILVFDEDQKFLYTADAVLGEATATAPTQDGVYLPDGKRDNIETMRSFEVKLVESSKPRYLHFVADYDWKNFSQDYFLKGTSAGELMTQLYTTLEGANGNNPIKSFSPMWSMVRVDKLNKTTLEGKVIKLLRNYAKIEIQVAPEVLSEDGFTIDGYCVANTLNKGMVAPFKVQNYTYEFPFNVTEATVPADAKFLPAPTDAFMITPDKTFNLFESKNDHDTKKVCVVIRGKKGSDTRYFKVDLVNRRNEFSINDYIQILRNNWYVINISRIKSKGYATLEDALKAPADNNVFASVEMKDFSKVSDGKYNLTADPIEMVIVKPGTYSFNTIFNGTSTYTRFYPDWDKGNDPLMGDWNKTTSTDPMQAKFTFTVDRIPADNIEEYKVEVVGLRYADKSGLNPGDPGYDPTKKTPVLDGVTGATTPITRTVHITLRSPYRFNATLVRDSKSTVVSDMLLSFEVYKSLPLPLLPLEVLIEARDITPRNQGGNATSDLMIVEREVVENGVKKKKLFYSYTLTPEAYTAAINGDHRISIPVTINNGTATLPGPIILSSELYTNQTIYGVGGGTGGDPSVRENAFVIDYFLPDDSYKTMPSTAENDIHFKLGGVAYTGDKIKLMSADDRGKFNLQILDNAIAGTQELEISAWITRENNYGYFKYLVKKKMTVAQWLAASTSVRFDGVSVSVKGFLYHNNNNNFRPYGFAPEIWGMYPGTSLDTNLTTVANYSLSDNGKSVNGEWGYEFTFTIPEATYVANANSLKKWTGIGFGYFNLNKWPAKWNELINSTRVVYWEY